MEEHTREVLTCFDQQKQTFLNNSFPTFQERKANLLKLKQALLKNKELLAAAISADFSHRSQHETFILEIFPSVEAIDYTIKNLKKWMKPETRKASIWFKPSRLKVIRQPLGVVGIIVPWNYPIYLAIGPLVAAIAAGNKAMLKMPEATPKLSEAFKYIINELFTEESVKAFTGGPELAAFFSGLSFDHLFFTGSTAVGKKVMMAASHHLTPVTLELGGKSPCIIGRSFPLKQAVKKIWAGKLLNAGQTCVAPDYVFVPSEALESFIELSKEVVTELYGQQNFSRDYSCIVSEGHHQRLSAMAAEARESQIQVIEIDCGSDAKKSRHILPTIICNPPENILVMQEEVFGPILPVKTYHILDDAIQYINAKPRPLALYYFDYDSDNIENILHKTHSGGVSINNTMMQVAQDDLPFGGVGPSGIGSYHAKEGFDTFSHKKSVYYQSKLDLTQFFYPPFNGLTDKLLGFMLRK